MTKVLGEWSGSYYYPDPKDEPIYSLREAQAQVKKAREKGWREALEEVIKRSPTFATLQDMLHKGPPKEVSNA